MKTTLALPRFCAQLQNSLTVSIVTLCLLCASLPSAAVLVTQYWGGGEADIADNTDIPIGSQAAMCGIWNTTTKNWANKTNAPNTYAAWDNGVEKVAYFRAHMPNSSIDVTVTVATDMVLHQLRDDMTAAGNTYNQEFVFNATSPVTLRFEPLPDGTPPKIGGSGDRTRGNIFSANVKLGGTNGFWLIGGRSYVKSASDDLSGTVRLDGSAGNLYLDSAGSLKGLSEVYLRNTELFLFNPGSAGALDRLNDAAVIRGSSRGGAFQYQGQQNATAPSSETIGKLLLDGHLPLNIAVSSGSGALYPRLTLASGIDRGPTGKGTMVVSVAAAAPFIRAQVIVSNPPCATDTLIPWMATETGGFCKIRSSDLSIDAVSMTPAPNDLLAWQENVDYTLARSFTPVNALTSLTINSLGIMCSNMTLTLANDAVLTIKSGGLTYQQVVVTPARAITNGYLTSGTNDLYILTASNGTDSSLNIFTPIVGNINVIFGGNLLPTLVGTRNNTYTGTTYVNGRVTLNKSASAIAIPGNLDIARNAIVNFGAQLADQIVSTANIIVREGGTLNQADCGQTYAGTITIEGGLLQNGYRTMNLSGSGYGLIFNGGTINDTRSDDTDLNDLNTDVRYQSSATMQAQWTGAAGSRVRVAGTRTFDIADSASLPAGISEMVMKQPMEHNGSMSLTKQGSGVLEYAAGVTQHYNGATTVAAGTLLVNGVVATSTVTVAAGDLKGNGKVRSLVVQGSGTVRPGTSVGVLSVLDNATLEDDATLEIEWNDGVTNDILVVGGTFTAQGQPAIKVLNIGGIPGINTQVVLKVTGTYTGPVSGYTFDLPTGWTAITSGGDLINMGGNNYGLAFIPEPAAGLGLLLLGVLLRKRS